MLLIRKQDVASHSFSEYDQYALLLTRGLLRNAG